MRTIFLATLLLAAAVGAQPAVPATAVQPAVPATGAQPAMDEKPAPATGNYICEDGNLLHLLQDPVAGVLTGSRAGESFTLQQQVTRGPSRFVNGPDSILLDGDSLRLRRAGNVRQACQRVPDAPVAGTVWGTITKLDRMALPEGTRAKVLLVDAARADAPAVEIGSFELRTTGNQVPFWFLIRYDPARAMAPARPQLAARIQTAKGELLYITDQANPIPTDGAPQSPLELQLVRVGG